MFRRRAQLITQAAAINAGSVESSMQPLGFILMILRHLLRCCGRVVELKLQLCGLLRVLLLCRDQLEIQLVRLGRQGPHFIVRALLMVTKTADDVGSVSTGSLSSNVGTPCPCLGEFRAKRYSFMFAVG